MAGYVCTVAGGNGGVGKTTTAINLAAAFQERGHDTAVVDADLAMPNVAELLGADFDRTLHEILADESTISETLTEAPGGLTIIPGEPSLEAYADADPTRLRKVIRTLAQIYDVVIVDTAAGLGKETTIPMEVADGVVLVTIPDHVSLTDTGKTGKIADLVESDIVGALIVRTTERTPMGDIAAELDFPLLGGIPADFDVVGEEPLVLEAPESDLARAYRAVTDDLEAVFVGREAATDLSYAPRESTD